MKREIVKNVSRNFLRASYLYGLAVEEDPSNLELEAGPLGCFVDSPFR